MRIAGDYVLAKDTLVSCGVSEVNILKKTDCVVKKFDSMWIFIVVI